LSVRHPVEAVRPHIHFSNMSFFRPNKSLVITHHIISFTTPNHNKSLFPAGFLPEAA